MAGAVSIHPSVDGGVESRARKTSPGGSWRGGYADEPSDWQLIPNPPTTTYELRQMLEPAGASFSIIAVVPRDKLAVTAKADKLKIVDAVPRSSAMHARTAEFTFTAVSRMRSIRFMARVIHTELSPDTGWSEPTFAAFVSSIIESGADPANQGAVRSRLKNSASNLTIASPLR